MKIGYVPYSNSFDKPGDRRRFVNYARKRGINFEIADPEKKYDVVVLSERADISVWANYKHGKLIFDLIDSYLSVPRTDVKGLFRGLAKFVSRQSRYLQLNHWQAVEKMCRRSAAVICTTEEQKAAIYPFCQNTHIVLDAHDMVANQSGIKKDFSASQPFKVVWEGLPHTLSSLKIVTDVLSRINQKYPLEIHVVTDLEYFRYLGRFGKASTADLLKSFLPNAILHEWSEQTCASIIQSCDLALIPLSLTEPFAAGKPENKLLLFWKLGMPVLTSATPAYKRAMHDAGITLNCESELDWETSLIRCIEDKNYRKEVATLGNELAINRHSEKNNLLAWDKVFDSIESNTKRIQILILLNSFESGGTEGHILNTLSKLDHSRFEIHLLAINKGGRLMDSFLKSGLKIVDPYTGNGLKQFFSSLASELRLRKPIVHCFLPKPYLFGGSVALALGAPAILMSRRSRNHYQERHWVAAKLEKYLHSKVDRLLANSNAVTNDLLAEGALKNKIQLIYNGIDVTQFELGDARRLRRDYVRAEFNISDQTVVLICVANLYPYKGHQDLLSAIAIIQKHLLKDIVLLVVGRSGDTQKLLEVSAKRLGILNNVRFLGERSDVPHLLAASDIGVLSSHEEGFSNAVLECMAASLPVVVTDVGGNSEAVLDGECGFVVPPHHPNDLSNALSKLIANEPLRVKFGASARERVSKLFSLDLCIKEYEKVYTDLWNTAQTNND